VANKYTRRQRKKQAVRKIGELASKGAFAQYTKKPGGLRKFSAEALQAAKGRAPLPVTNRMINEELRRRSTAGKYR
jgi:hypothetical protein